MSSPARTENGDVAYSTTGSARVDFFSQAVRNTEMHKMYSLLTKSLEEDVLDSFKLVFQLRDFRAEEGKSAGGKGERELFRQCLKILASLKPKSLLLNLELISKYGRWDDLFELFMWKPEDYLLGLPKDEHLTEDGFEIVTNKKRKRKRNEIDLYPDPMSLRKIQDAILALIKKQLNEDLKALQNNETVSLCAKWIPSENQHHDKKMRQLRKKLKNSDSDEYKNDTSLPYTDSLTKCISRALGVNKATLRKKYISPLRKHLKIVETYMSSKDYSLITYDNVPSQAMMKHKKAFLKNDEARYLDFTNRLKKGEAKVNSSTLSVTQIVEKYYSGQEEDIVYEKQWEGLVEETRKLGSLEKALVLSDVSGSMAGNPMIVSIALGILISSLSKYFKNEVITFDEIPTWFKVKGKTLKERVTSLASAPWGGSTNFDAAFKLILKKAIALKIPQNEMPDTLFIISDMQFNQADSSFGASSHLRISDEFKKAGYEVPRIVYWNVRSTETHPVVSSVPNTAILSGYSQSSLKSVLSGDSKYFTPYYIMRAAIDDERYNYVKVDPSEL